MELGLAASQLARALWGCCYNPGSHGTVALGPLELEFLLVVA